MNFWTNLIKNHDWILTSVVALLITVGSIAIYSVTYNSTTPESGQGAISKHMSFVGLGVLVYILVSNLDYRWLKSRSIILGIFGICILLLLYVKFFTAEIAGTNRWIQLGPINLQPAEISKIAIIILTSAIISRQSYDYLRYDTASKYSISSNLLSGQARIASKNKLHQVISDDKVLQKALLSLVYTAPLVFLILIEPSLGNSIIALGIWIGIILSSYPRPSQLTGLALAAIGVAYTSYTLFVADFELVSILHMVLGIVICTWSIYALKPQLSHTIIVLIIATLILPVANFGWHNILKDYQRQRIESFVDPTKDPTGSGWQVLQSQVAVGSGRIFGRGFREGTQSGLKILPFAYTDFVFAAYTEQFGFVGAIFLLILLFSLPLRIFWIGIERSDYFAKYLCYGIGTMLLIHILVNIGMNLGKLPVTGIPLPFISYGGSAILTNLISIGLVQSCKNFDIINTNTLAQTNPNLYNMQVSDFKQI